MARKAEVPHARKSAYDLRTACSPAPPHRHFGLSQRSRLGCGDRRTGRDDRGEGGRSDLHIAREVAIQLRRHRLPAVNVVAQHRGRDSACALDLDDRGLGLHVSEFDGGA